MDSRLVTAQPVSVSGKHKTKTEVQMVQYDHKFLKKYYNFCQMSFLSRFIYLIFFFSNVVFIMLELIIIIEPLLKMKAILFAFDNVQISIEKGRKIKT